MIINDLKDKMLLHTNRDYKITRGHVVSCYPLTSRPCSISIRPQCFVLVWEISETVIIHMLASDQQFERHITKDFFTVDFYEYEKDNF